MKGPITIDFFEKDATVNSASTYQLLRQNSPYLLNDSCTIHLQEYSNVSQQQELYTYCSMNKQYVEWVQNGKMLT